MLLSFIFSLLAINAQAQQLVVQEVAMLDGNIQTVNVASQTATDMTAATSTGTIAGAFAVEIYNINGSTNTINCGFSPSVSTVTTSGWYGREVLAGSAMTWQLRQGIGSPVKKVYCLTQNTGGITRATVTQMK